jgi:hypothetical protein
MKKVVERERNKTYYRILHLPIWIWVFFIMPGHLTFAISPLRSIPMAPTGATLSGWRWL